MQYLLRLKVWQTRLAMLLHPSLRLLQLYLLVMLNFFPVFRCWMVTRWMVTQYSHSIPTTFQVPPQVRSDYHLALQHIMARFRQDLRVRPWAILTRVTPLLYSAPVPDAD